MAEYTYEDAESDLAMARFADRSNNCDAAATLAFLHELGLLAPDFSASARTARSAAVRDMCEVAAEAYDLELHREADGLTVTSDWRQVTARLRLREAGDALLEDDAADGGDGDE